MAEVLNRMGFRLRKVVKAKPQKKLKETDAIFGAVPLSRERFFDVPLAHQPGRKDAL
jgi:hypothetical protein